MRIVLMIVAENMEIVASESPEGFGAFQKLGNGLHSAWSSL